MANKIGGTNKMYRTIRWYYPNGDEWEAMECTIKEWSSLEKAVAYCHRYSKGVRFVSAEIEDESGRQIYELLSDGTVTMNLPEILK